MGAKDMTKKLNLVDFFPKSKLKVKETLIDKPKFPFIDGHSHLQLLGGNWIERPVEDLLTMMNNSNIQAIVDLDGLDNDSILFAHIEKFKAKAPDRFYHMGGVDWTKWKEKGNNFGNWAAKRLEEQIREYRKFIHKMEKRIQKDIDEIEKVFSDTYENTTFTEKFKRTTIRRFLEHLPLHEIIDAINIACSRIYDNPESTIKYFCGICWNKINVIKPEKQIPKIWKELSNYCSRGSGHYRPSDIELIKHLDQNSIKEVMTKALTGERQDNYWNYFMELMESQYD